MATVSGKIFQVKDGTSNLFPRTVIEAVYGLDKTIADVKTWVGKSFVKYSHSIYNPTSAVDLNSQHVAENTIQQISWDFSTYSNVSNRPFSSASAASVLVLPNAWGGLQFYTDYNSNTYYIRNRYSTTGWKSWVQLYHTGNFNPANYLPIAAQGATVYRTTSGPIVSFNNSKGANEEAYLIFQSNGTSKTAVGWNSTRGTYIYNYPSAKYLGIKDDGTPHYQGNTLWHAGNLTSSAITGILASGSIANGKLANSSITINGTSTSLGGTFNTASITAGTAGTSSATSGLSFAIPYVTLNAYGVATAYGTHTHSISKANITSAIGSTTYAPYNSAGYLPLSGGTMRGGIVFSSGSPVVQFDVDTSRARSGIAWLNTSSAVVGSILMYNTAKAIYINATGASASYSDTVGKYSLKVGENSLTYNTYSIYHTNNLTKSVVTGLIGSTTYAPYNAAGYLPLSGGTLTGNLTAPKFIRTGGTSSQFLKADGSVDSSAYLTTATAANTYLPLSGGTMAGTLVLSRAVPLSFNDSGGTARTGVFLNSSNGFYVGYGTSAAGYDTYLGGNQIYFQYGTGHATGMTLTSSGNVGIGTTTPAYKLDVTGSIRAAERVVATTGFGTVDTPASAFVASPGWYRIWSSNVNDIGGNNIILFINRAYGSGQPENFAFEINIEGDGAISITQLSGNRQSTRYKYLTKLRVVWAYNTANSVFIDFYYDSSSSNAIRVHGYAGKGQFQPAVAVTDTPANAVEFDLLQDCFKTNKNIVAMGTIRSTTGIFSDGYVSALGTASSSDAKLKDDITTISYDRAKAVISALNPREWTWNALTSKEGERGAGMVAQEVESILPDTVKEIGGNLTLEYNTLFAYGLAATKYMLPMVETHEEKIARLEKEVEELKRQLTN